MAVVTNKSPQENCRYHTEENKNREKAACAQPCAKLSVVHSINASYLSGLSGVIVWPKEIGDSGFNDYFPAMPADMRTAVVTQSIAIFWNASGELDSIRKVSPDIT